MRTVFRKPQSGAALMLVVLTVAVGDALFEGSSAVRRLHSNLSTRVYFVLLVLLTSWLVIILRYRRERLENARPHTVVVYLCCLCAAFAICISTLFSMLGR